MQSNEMLVITDLLILVPPFSSLNKPIADMGSLFQRENQRKNLNR